MSVKPSNYKKVLLQWGHFKKTVSHFLLHSGQLSYNFILTARLITRPSIGAP